MMSQSLDVLLATHRPRPWRSVTWPIMLCLASLLVWSGFSHVDQVAVATGEVAPRGKVKVIQHLEGGIIQEINVEEGSEVKEGQPLLLLDLASTGVNRKELTARLDSEILKRARLAAEASGQQLDFPKEEEKRHPEIANAEQHVYEARRLELASSLAVLDEQLRQRRQDVEELVAKSKAANANLSLARQRLTLSESLLSQGLMAKMEHLQLRAEVEKLQGEVQSLNTAIPRASSSVAEAERRLTEGTTRFRSDAQEELGQVQQSIARLKEVLAEAKAQGARAEIRSPIDGIVKKLRYHTIGGVVSPGEPIMEIVPIDDRLVVVAKLSPSDRGYVHEGLPATVKVTAFDFIRYGSLDGHVVHVSPDATTEPNGQTVFEIVVETEKNFLGSNPGEWKISPGMQAIVDVHTGTRTVLSYLVTPILKLRAEAFRER